MGLGFPYIHLPELFVYLIQGFKKCFRYFTILEYILQTDFFNLTNLHGVITTNESIDIMLCVALTIFSLITIIIV